MKENSISGVCGQKKPHFGQNRHISVQQWQMFVKQLSISAGFDFPDWDLLRGNVAPTPEQQDALARFTAFTYLVTMGLMILFTLFYRRLRHGTRKTLRFSARGLNPVLLLWGLVMMLAAGIVIEPVVELLPMPSSAVYHR